MAKTKHRIAPSMDNIYTLDGDVPLLKSIPFGLQRVLAMFVASIAPIMIDRCQRSEPPGNCFPDSDRHDYGRYWYFDPAFYHLEAGCEAANRDGYQLYIRFCILLCWTEVGIRSDHRCCFDRRCP